MRFKHLLKRYNKKLTEVKCLKLIYGRELIKLMLPRLGNFPRIQDLLIDYVLD